MQIFYLDVFTEIFDVGVGELLASDDDSVVNFDSGCDGCVTAAATTAAAASAVASAWIAERDVVQRTSASASATSCNK